MDLTFQVPMQYCSLQHQALHHQSHPQRVLFLLWLHLFILSAIGSPLISRSILGTYQPEFIFQCSIFLPSSLCSSASFLHNPRLHVPAGIPHLCHLISSFLLAKTNSCFPMKHTSFQLYFSRLDVFCPASLQVCGMFNVFRSSC